MKKDIRTLAALLIASATFVACSSDDNIANENQQPANGKYTLTINASKSDDATTRALTIDDSGEKNVLNATWATTENVYVQKGSTWAEGSLQPKEAGTTTTLKGTLDNITIAKNDELTLQFPRSGARDYTGQVGTLADIAAKYDYAKATVEVEGVSGTGNIIPKSETTAFASQQAIVKFTLLDKADGTTPLSATQLKVNDGTTDYTITPASATSEIYVAIPGFSEQTVTLTATVGSKTYTYTTASAKTFTNGKYYEITVKMAWPLSAYYSKMVECGCDNLYGICYSSNEFTGQVLSAAQAIALAQAKAAETGSNCAVFYDHGDGDYEIRFAKNDGTTGSARYNRNAAAKGLSGYKGYYVSK